MIRKTLVPLLLVIVLSLFGCKKDDTSAVSSSAGGLNEDYTDALSIRSQLVLGTLKLEEGDLAVTGTQAADLLPLWQASRNLARSGIGATEEVNAVLDQIQGVMTQEQLQAIAGMALTRADNQAMSQAMGLSTGTGDGSGEGGGGQGKNLSAEERATRQAEKEASGAVGASEALLDVLIDMLETKSE
jgi:hypothetical protein